MKKGYIITILTAILIVGFGMLANPKLFWLWVVIAVVCAIVEIKAKGRN